MVIVTATPPIMFFAYASHIITRKLSIHISSLQGYHMVVKVIIKITFLDASSVVAYKEAIKRAARKKEEREYMKIRQKGLKEKLQPKVKSHTAKYIKHVRKRNKAKENLLKSPGINFKMNVDHFEGFGRP